MESRGQEGGPRPRGLPASGISARTSGGGGLKPIADYLSAKGTEPTARRYLSLHCLGGAIKTANKWSCFAYREMPFLLQYQAWWANKDQKDVEQRCIEWVRGFRVALKDFTKGSFINFPDREISLDQYYGDSYADLKKLKRAHDPNGVFDFPMGIPRS